ncbi:hypothetical protein WDW86_11455 [Bdellovibrionota bacterium FG-2]
MKPILDLIVFLENDLAECYRTLALKQHTLTSTEIFERLRLETEGHAAAIQKMADLLQERTLNSQAILGVHKNLKEILISKIRPGLDDHDLTAELAKVEEGVSQIYSALSEFAKAQALSYDKISTAVAGLSAQELRHRDALLKL